MTVEAFVPVLWSDKLLKRLKKEHVFPTVVNTDYEGDISAFGDTVRINQVGPVTISSYVPNTVNMTPETIQAAGEPLTIDQIKNFYFAIDDVDKAQIKGNVMEMAMDEAAYGIRDITDQFIAALIAASVASTNNVNVAGAVSSNTNPIVIGTGAGDADAFELLVQLNKLLNKANVPSGGRWCVIDPDFMAMLLIDPRFTSFATSQSLDIIKAGSTAGGENGIIAPALKTLVGMDVRVSNNLPTSGTGASAISHILAGYMGAVTYAEQIPEGQPEAFRLQTGFADAVRGLHLYGGKVTRPSALAEAYVQYAGN